jgi:hypothetical protein
MVLWAVLKEGCVTILGPIFVAFWDHGQLYRFVDPGLWINSTTRYRAAAIAWRSPALVSQNTSRTHCLCTPWSRAIPNNVATSSSNALRQRTFFHELAMFFNNHQVSCSHK